MRPDEAQETLRTVQETRRQTRKVLSESWFPLILFGLLSLVSAPLIAVFGGEVLGIYWPICGVLGGVATALHYRNRQSVIGLEDNAVGYVLTAAGIIIGAFVVGWVAGTNGNEMLAAVGPMVVVAIGYGIFAWLDRSISLGLAAASLLIVAATVAALDLAPDTVAVVLAITFGLVTVGVGSVQLRARRQLGV